MKWLLIRHGQTQGNREHRYIGCRTDEALCTEGIRQLQQRQYPSVGRVFASPMKRCLETAALLYPGVPVEIVEDFRECDFGDFENLNYAELNGRADYQAWIDSGGELPFPRGESRASFAKRCADAFDSIRIQPQDCALIAHGGTLMAIMERHSRPSGSYFDFQAGNGDGFWLKTDGRWGRLGIDTKAVQDYTEMDK